VSGQTSIEFWGRRLNQDIDADDFKRFNFSYTTYRNNLYVIFGTKNFLKMLLFSNINPLPTDGVEWDHVGQTVFNLTKNKQQLNKQQIVELSRDTELEMEDPKNF
jgi:hypothetical protein